MLSEERLGEIQAMLDVPHSSDCRDYQLAIVGLLADRFHLAVMVAALKAEVERLHRLQRLERR